MRVELPKTVAGKMSWWRMGCIEFPKEYIEFHESLALIKVEYLKECGYTIHRTYMAADGWMDGMRVLHVIVERGSELFKLRWHDGNQGWMRCCLGGGGAISWKPPIDEAEAAERRASADIALKTGRYQL